VGGAGQAGGGALAAGGLEADALDRVQHVAVVHRLPDLEAAGGRDSEQVKLARGLLSACWTSLQRRHTIW